MGYRDIEEIVKIIRETEAKEGRKGYVSVFSLKGLIMLLANHLLKVAFITGIGGFFVMITIILPFFYSAMFSQAGIDGFRTEHISFETGFLLFYGYCGLPFFTSYLWTYGLVGTIMFLFFNPEKKPINEYTLSASKEEINFLDVIFLGGAFFLIFFYNIFFPVFADIPLREIFENAAKQKAILPIVTGVTKYYVIGSAFLFGIVYAFLIIIGVFVKASLIIDKVFSVLLNFLSKIKP